MKVSEQIAIMKAYEDGKTIERLYTCSNGNTMWETIKEYREDYPFNFQANNYRIKQEPEYRPFETTPEAFKEAKKHGFWIKHKYTGNLRWITLIELNSKNGIYLGCSLYSENALKNYVWADDGSPCGIKID